MLSRFANIAKPAQAARIAPAGTITDAERGHAAATPRRRRAKGAQRTAGWSLPLHHHDALLLTLSLLCYCALCAHVVLLRCCMEWRCVLLRGDCVWLRPVTPLAACALPLPVTPPPATPAAAALRRSSVRRQARRSGRQEGRPGRCRRSQVEARWHPAGAPPQGLEQGGDRHLGTQVGRQARRYRTRHRRRRRRGRRAV